MPYTTPEDYRFTSLKDTFFNYLETWKESTLNQDRDFSANARQKMFLSELTYEGLKITVYSHIEVVKFLLSMGFEYLLTERFMQDALKITWSTKERGVED